jgi:flagellar biosynthesis protein FlhG
MAAEGKKARRIAVISGKGGVGKTVITANLAAAWTAMGRRILVVDADLGLANLDILLGVDPPFTIQDAFRGIRPLEEILVHTGRGFDLLPAGSGLPEGAAFTAAMAENMTSILDSLGDRYDAILFDAGAGVGDVVLFFAGLAHEILLVATPEPTSLMDAYATIKIVSQLHQRNEFFLVVNQTDPLRSGQVGTAIANHLQNVISKFLRSKDQSPVRVELVGAIPQDPAIPQAIRQRRLLAETAPGAPSAGLMNTLAGFFDTRILAAS